MTDGFSICPSTWEVEMADPQDKLTSENRLARDPASIYQRQASTYVHTHAYLTHKHIYIAYIHTQKLNI